MVLRTLLAAGPYAQVVARYGDDIKAIMKALFLNFDVSATKMVKEKINARRTDRSKDLSGTVGLDAV